ncbi:MAG: XTP/dITP diphosphatase [Dehalococcoidia bacterium]|nr:XTP/dITP diphosphatase [Dehalococcoidia bacterium]
MTSRPRLLVATRNHGKLRELSDLLGSVPFELVSLADVGIEIDVEETGHTFEDNAVLKAETYRDLSSMLTLADDSGLEVDALGGEPGVRSARYAGPSATDADRIQLLLKNLQSTPEATWDAQFTCVIAIASPGEETRLFPGSCRGRIVREPRGEHGFGYDPVFLFPDLGLTMAELTPEQKNEVSHRALAVRKAANALASGTCLHA